MVENGEFYVKSMIRINFQFNIKTCEMSFIRKIKIGEFVGNGKLNLKSMIRINFN